MDNTVRILSLDYGTRRIGVAVSDPLALIGQPLEFIPNGKDHIGEIKKIIDKYLPVEIIVGYPLNLKGEVGSKAMEVDLFIAELEKNVSVPVIRWDERFTTKIAIDSMRQMNMKRKDRESRKNVDSMAAAINLQNYLDYRRKR